MSFILSDRTYKIHPTLRSIRQNYWNIPTQSPLDKNSLQTMIKSSQRSDTHYQLQGVQNMKAITLETNKIANLAFLVAPKAR